jgi:hypothetical protein
LRQLFVEERKIMRSLVVTFVLAASLAVPAMSGRGTPSAPARPPRLATVASALPPGPDPGFARRVDGAGTPGTGALAAAGLLIGLLMAARR